MGTRMLIAIVMLMVTAGCGAERAPQVAGGEGLGITLSPIENFSINAEAADLELGDITDATRLPNGSVAVADAFGDAVKIIGPDGKLVRAIGRNGEGPGEFRSPGWIERCYPDSLFVWDRLRGVMSVYGTDGSFIREFAIAGSPQTIACNRSGMIVTLLWSAVPHDATGDYPILIGTINVIDVASGAVASVGDFPAGQARPLGLMTVLAVGRDEVVVGTADSAVILIRNLRSGETRSQRIDAPRKAATEAHYDAAISRLMDRVQRSNRDSMIRRVMHEVPMPALLPAYRGIVVDDSGLLWITTSAYGSGSTELVIVDPSSGRDQRVTLTREVDVVEVGPDYLLARYMDDEGVGHLVSHAVSRGGQRNR